MVSRSLDKLPEELIGIVAIHSDAITVLKLSHTCHRARSACYNIPIFQEILIRSQSSAWTSDTLSLEAITARAGGDVSVWARYAVADYCTADLWQARLQSDQEPIFLPNEPELFLVNHPSLYQRCWKRIMKDVGSISENEVYCLALSILAGKEPLRELQQSLQVQKGWYDALNSETSIGFAWAFCMSVLVIRNQLHRRLAAWPYSDAALVPHIPLPSPRDLSNVLPYNKLPLPFSKGAAGVRSNWSPDQLSQALNPHQDIIGTRWKGYYTYLFDDNALDPPMMDVRFEKSLTETDRSEKPRIQASGCRDGIGSFEIHGSITSCEHGLIFNGRKSYAGWEFDWRVKWQSSNLAVGFWGRFHEGEFHKDGLICLWKDS